MHDISSGAWRWTILTAVAAVLAGCGTTTPSQTATSSRTTNHASPGGTPVRHLEFTPEAGGPTTVFTVRSGLPTTTAGVAAGQRLSYILALTGPSRAGCIGARSITVATPTAGAPLIARIDPARLGGQWCEGIYSARLSETESPVCPAGTMCPQYRRDIGTVATGSFRVTGSS